MKHSVSIVIPAKNEENMIGKCLDAISGIDYPAELYEIIVVDNGSFDRTMEIAGEYTEYVYSMPSGTISSLRNFGAKKSSADYIAFIDADVVVKRNWIKNAMELLASDTSIACVGCSPQIPSRATWVERAWHMDVMAKPQQGKRSWIASMNMIVRRDVFEEIGGFNEKLVTCEDVDLGYRITEKYYIVEDKSIEAVHLGEAKNLVQLFKKEMWRGKSSFSGMAEHGFVMGEVPSLALQFIYLAFICTIVISCILKKIALIGLCFGGSLLFPIIRAVITMKRLGRVTMIVQTVIVWWVYYFARAFSLLSEIKGVFHLPRR